jgi:hypothetical protein
MRKSPDGVKVKSAAVIEEEEEEEEEEDYLAYF